MLVTKKTVIEYSAVVLLARVLGAGGTPIVPADVAAIVVRVYDADDETLVTPAGEGDGYDGTALNVGVAVKPAPVTAADDPRWPYADAGYNVEIALDGSYVPEGRTTYQVEARVTPSAGDAYYLLWQLTTVGVLSE